MSNMHLEIKGPPIKGAATADGFVGQIDIQSWSWGNSHDTSAKLGSGTATAKGKCGKITFTKLLDRSSTTLAQMCLCGQPFGEMILHITKSGDAKTPPIEFMTISLTTAMIASHQISASPNGGTETMVVDFAEVMTSYANQEDKGMKGGSIDNTWLTREGIPG